VNRAERTKVILLISSALTPFMVTFFVPAMPWFGRTYYIYCALCGFAWCSLYAYFLAGSTGEQRSRLLWLLPLLVFAFCVPGDFLYLAAALAKGGLHGEMP